jgi:DNA-binding MarR family transcriptional regulator
VALKRAEQSMVRAKTAALKPAGLTLAQYVALAELERQPGITAATLARACFVTPQAMMVVLKSSEEQGLVVRSTHPRHPSVLELNITPAGRDLLHAGRVQVEPVEARILAAFTSEELATLHELLIRWVAALEEGETAPASAPKPAGLL